ncbi:MAG: hypothetical protein NTV74_06860 [Euryarchaeota archaeon]|nr:hypothetical protein [Euryarchaeota archaeon]
MDFNLTNKQKSNLIEVLLIVGSILSALQLPKNLIWIFMLFVISSIVYFILIQKEIKGYKLSDYLLVVFVSLCFSGIVSYELGFSIGIMLSSQYIIITYFVTIVYYLLLAWIVYMALRMGKFIQFRKKESNRKETVANDSAWSEHPAFIKIKK